jgi:hypothetical protein
MKELFNCFNDNTRVGRIKYFVRKTRNPLFTQRVSQEMIEEKLLLLRGLLGGSFLYGLLCGFLNCHDIVLLS